MALGEAASATALALQLSIFRFAQAGEAVSLASTVPGEGVDFSDAAALVTEPAIVDVSAAVLGVIDETGEGLLDLTA